MLNLVMNGIDAMTDVTNRLRELVVSSRVHVNGQVSGIVTDSSVVVDLAVVAGLFDPVFTTKEGDRGIGLSSVNPLSKAMLASDGHRRTTDAAYRFTSLRRRSNEQ
jgi:C4-dicarboxylate-specific signal transduction histidine kinase